MSRRFDGSDDNVQWEIGACSLTGAWTFACVIKLDTGVSWQAYLSNDSVGSSQVAMGRHSGGNIATYTGGGANTQTAISHSSSDGWMLVAATRAAGSSIPTMHKYPIGGSPTHTAAGAAQSNQPAQDAVVFGAINGSDWFDGWMVVAAEWNTALSNATIESLVTSFTRDDWLATSPVGLWDEYDVFATDRTGNGADLSVLVGTTDDADDPAGWDAWEGGGEEPPPTVAQQIRPTTAGRW